MSYYSSTQWKQICEQAIQRDNGKCQECGSTKLLAVHHKTYENFGHELLGDLQTLCGSCHRIAHCKPNNPSVNTKQNKCNRCNHAWHTYLSKKSPDFLPQRCARCRSPLWNTPRRNKQPRFEVMAREQHIRQETFDLIILALQENDGIGSWQDAVDVVKVLCPENKQ